MRKQQQQQQQQQKENTPILNQIRIQEVVRNTRLRLVFLSALLSCSSRFLRALQQNRAQSSLTALFLKHANYNCLNARRKFLFFGRPSNYQHYLCCTEAIVLFSSDEIFNRLLYENEYI